MGIENISSREENVEDSPSLFRNYKVLSDLIDSGDTVDVALLKNALKNMEINQKQYTILVTKRAEKSEIETGGLASTAIELQDRAEASEYDPTTELFRQHVLEKKLGELIHELNLPIEKNRRIPVLESVIVIWADLDNLKAWNNYGQHKGDKALNTLAHALKETLRPGDQGFRRGDRADEFIFLLRIDKKLEPAKLEGIFQHIQGVANSKYIEQDGKKLPVTAAMGYVVLQRGDSRTVEEILNDANRSEMDDKTKETKDKRIHEAQEKLS